MFWLCVELMEIKMETPQQPRAAIPSVGGNSILRTGFARSVGLLGGVIYSITENASVCLGPPIPEVCA